MLRIFQALAFIFLLMLGGKEKKGSHWILEQYLPTYPCIRIHCPSLLIIHITEHLHSAFFPVFLRFFRVRKHPNER